MPKRGTMAPACATWALAIMQEIAGLTADCNIHFFTPFSLPKLIKSRKNAYSKRCSATTYWLHG